MTPKDYCINIKQVLEDKALNRRYKEVDALFEEDFNKTPDKIFKAITGKRDYTSVFARQINDCRSFLKRWELYYFFCQGLLWD